MGKLIRCISEDGTLTGLIAASECIGIEEKGVHVYNKHCVVNDQEACRHGVGVWLPEQALREIYLRAFELPITLGGAYNTMASFARLGTQSGCACPALAENFLRGECGMKGIAVTDMWYGTASTYMNLPQMLVAGCNLIDGQQEASQLDASKPNHADVAWGMRESVHRILYTVVHSRAMNGISANTVIKQLTPWWQTLLNGLEIGFGVIVLASVAWIIVTEVKKKRK